MFRPLVAQARACDRGRPDAGPLTQAARLLDRYGPAAAVLFAEDSRVLTVLRALEEEAGHG